MAYGLFTSARLNAPYCKQVCEHADYAPEGTHRDHPGLGTLTFRRAEIVAAPR